MRKFYIFIGVLLSVCFLNFGYALSYTTTWTSAQSSSQYDTESAVNPPYYAHSITANSKAESKAQAYYGSNMPSLGVFANGSGQGSATITDNFYVGFPGGQISSFNIVLRVRLKGYMIVPIWDQGQNDSVTLTIRATYTPYGETNATTVFGSVTLVGSDWKPCYVEASGANNLWGTALNPLPTINQLNYPTYTYQVPATPIYTYYGRINLNDYLFSIPLDDFAPGNPEVAINLSGSVSNNGVIDFYNTLEFDAVFPVGILEEDGQVDLPPDGFAYQLGENAPIVTVVHPPVYVSKDGSCSGNSPCFTNIQSGIASVSTSTTIKITQETYDENILLDFDEEITLQGGWDTTFTAIQSNTTINGSLTISNGTLTVENIILQ